MMDVLRFDDRRLFRRSFTVGMLLSVCAGVCEQRVFAGTFANEIAKFTASDDTADDLFGWLVDVDDGTTIAGKFPLAPGAAYLFDTATMQQTHKLTVPGVTTGEYFGSVVSIDGNTALVGAPGDTTLGTPPAGGIYSFNVATGVEIGLGKITPNDSATGDEFGFSLAQDGNLAMVGAPHGGTSAGAAYLMNVSTGGQEQKYTASDGTPGNDYGYSVDVDDGAGLAIVGAPNNNRHPAFAGRPGAAYVYDSLNNETILTPSDSSGGDEYGWSVAIDKTRVAIGAPKRGVGQGAAYVRDLVSGVEMKLTPPASFNGDDFGYAVDIQDNLVIVGAPGNDNPNDEPNSSAFVYSVTTGDLLDEFLFSDGAGDDEYGFSVGLWNNQAVVGAPLHNLTGKLDAGAAYLYTLGQCGDTDLDRDVDITDFNTLAASFDPNANNAPHPWADGNFDADLDVDITDFNCLAGNFAPSGYGGHAVPTGDGDLVAGQVPEPATVLLVCLAVAILGVGLRVKS